MKFLFALVIATLLSFALRDARTSLAAPPLQLPWPTGTQHRISGGNTYGCDTHTDTSKNYYGINFQFTIGDGVTATAGGTVTVASVGYNGGAGNYVVVNHDDG